jgi:hypothetical protein
MFKCIDDPADRDREWVGEGRPTKPDTSEPGLRLGRLECPPSRRAVAGSTRRVSIPTISVRNRMGRRLRQQLRPGGDFKRPESTKVSAVQDAQM